MAAFRYLLIFDLMLINLCGAWKESFIVGFPLGQNFDFDAEMSSQWEVPDFFRRSKHLDFKVIQPSKPLGEPCSTCSFQGQDFRQFCCKLGSHHCCGHNGILNQKFRSEIKNLLFDGPTLIRGFPVDRRLPMFKTQEGGSLDLPISNFPLMESHFEGFRKW